MKYPLVSVILSTYNGNHKWLSEAIESVLNQSYDNFEFIIVNDGSTNDIEKTILEYKEKDSRIVYIKNEKNLGTSGAKNKAIGISKGKYIAIIDDDDIWCDKDKLKKQVEFMENNPDYGLCGTGVIIIDEKGDEKERFLNPETDESIRKYIGGSGQFIHSSVLMKKDLVVNVGMYCTKSYCYTVEDYDLILKLGVISKLYNLPYFCTKYRVYSNNTSNKKFFIHKFNSFRTYLRYFKYYPNKFSSLVKHIVNIILPKQIARFLARLYRPFKK